MSAVHLTLAQNAPSPIFAVILSEAQRSRKPALSLPKGTCFLHFCRKGGKPQLSIGLDREKL
jgi:hypothetical protein